MMPAGPAFGLENREWGRHFVVENAQRSTDPFGYFVPNFSVRACARTFGNGRQEGVF